MLLSDEHIALLAKYYKTVELTKEQKGLLIEKYWEANKEERREIARAYASLFANDASFMQQLMLYYDTYVALPNSSRVNGRSGGKDGIGESNSRTNPNSSTDDGQKQQQLARASRPTKMASGVPFSHAQLLLRTAIQDQYPKLSGDGPFPVSFGLVQAEEERREVVDLYSTQFQYPDPPELHRLVTLPQSHSTRTRRRAKGNYTWYLRSHTTGEMVCAITIKAHHYDTHRFVEVPLFATGVGYKKCGFGRLMNTALLQWCAEEKFEFVMISADVQAIPFWTHLGYNAMSKTELTRIAFFYEHECYKFKGAEALIRYCKTWPKGGMQTTLERNPKVVIVGHPVLPSP